MFGYEDGKTYFGENFVNQMETILKNSKEKGQFLFIHGTRTDDNAAAICRNGLISDYPELNYTADLIRQDDELLYDKLKSWPHWNLKYLVMCLVPNQSGKGGLPIWTKQEDGFCLPPQFIRGYIDVNKRQIIDNELYNEKCECLGEFDDLSYRPISGEFIEISLPPDELAFYEEMLGDDR